jgi:hypothetical protein
MSSPGIRPRNNKPAAAPEGKKGSRQNLRVHAEDGAARAAPSIAMPRAKTELSELLAGDSLLCVRRRASATATRPKTDAEPGVSADGKSQAESPAALAGGHHVPMVGNPDSSPQACTGDEDLGRVIDAWPGLPRNVRAGILAMIRATTAANA